MSTRSHSPAAQRRGTSRSLSRRPCRFQPACESLESRRLLSAFQAGYSVGALPTPIVARPAVAAIPFIAGATAGGQAAGQVRSGYAIPQVAVGNGAGFEDELANGVGSIQLNFVITSLVSSSNATVPAMSTTTNLAATGTLSPITLIFITTLPSSPGSGGIGSSTPTTTTSGSTTSNLSTSSSDLLTPILLTGTTAGGRSVIVVILVPSLSWARPGRTNAPVTPQPLNSLLSSRDPLATPTQFGQSLEEPFGALFEEPPIAPPAEGPAWLDVVEPFPAAGPEVAPGRAGRPAPSPEAARGPAPSLPSLFDRDEAQTALDLAGWDRLFGPVAILAPSPPEGRSGPAPPRWGFSTVFGLTAVATGGYQLALQQAGRVHSRWIPARSEAGRRTGRRFGVPARSI